MPKPMLPALSEYSSASALEIQSLSWNTEIPLYCLKKVSHIFRSFCIFCVTRIWWYGFETPQVAFMSLRKNGQPGMIALHANCNTPMRDCNAFKVTFLFDIAASIFWMISWTLSMGKRTTISSESNSSPKKTKDIGRAFGFLTCYWDP